MLLLSACGQAIPAVTIPTRTAIVAKTSTPVPTLTPLPTPTSSSTPFPPLSENGPYLMLIPNHNSEKLYIYDANGHGRRIVALPSGGHIMERSFYMLNDIISPDGKWLVYYSGSIDDDILPVTLNLLNISDGTTKKIADVVTEGYKQKLNSVANELKQLSPDFYKPTEDGRDWVNGGLINNFEWDIYSVAWSPDSHYLAFAGQIDGNSSDVYVFDMESNVIQKVEDTLQNVQWIEWSPDGKYVVFKNSQPGPVYDGSSFYAVKPGAKVVKDPKQLASGTWLGIGEWLSSNILLAADGTDTAGRANLYTIDITTGQTKVLWDDSLSGYAIDYQNHIIAVTTSEFSEPANYGLYFITFSGSKKKILNDFIEAGVAFRGGGKHRFLMAEYNSGWDIYGINPNNTTTLIGRYQQQYISPDYLWLLLSDERKMDLYDKNDELARTFLIPDIEEVLWRPDSQGIFYSTGNELYYLAIPDGMPILVDKCELEECSFDLRYSEPVWLP